MRRLRHTGPVGPRTGSGAVRVTLWVRRHWLGSAAWRPVRVGGQLVLGYIAVSPRRALEPRRSVVPGLVARLPGGPARRRARLVRGHVGTSPRPGLPVVAVRRRAQRHEAEVVVG